MKYIGNTIHYTGNDNAIKYIKSLPKRTRQNWDKLFQNINPQAADLLNKMLTFNPDKRYTVEECLCKSSNIQLMHILIACMMSNKNQFVRKCLIGHGITSNRQRNFFRIWFTNKVYFIILK